MYFYWKISYSENLLYTAPGQPGGTKTLSEGGGAGPSLAPRWLRPCTAADLF